MRDLSTVREGWASVRRVEIEMLRRKSVAETLAEVEQLYAEFKPQLDGTDALFAPARERYLVELQHRLARLGQWLEEHPGARPA